MVPKTTTIQIGLRLAPQLPLRCSLAANIQPTMPASPARITTVTAMAISLRPMRINLRLAAEVAQAGARRAERFQILARARPGWGGGGSRPWGRETEGVAAHSAGR